MVHEYAPFPTQAWNNIAVDFIGLLPSGYHLCCVVDYYSRFIKVKVTKEAAANKVIEF
jgi:hypothetical protein